MRNFLQKLLGNWVIRMSNRFGSRPISRRINAELSELYSNINQGTGKKGLIFNVKPEEKFIIFSDQHKGARDFADDFALAEKNYLQALEFYNEQGYHYINLGDSEELWENLLESVIKHNKKTFESEKCFIQRKAFTKIFGNHDLYWDNDPLSGLNLKRIYDESIRIYEGAVLRFSFAEKNLDVFLTHGHQGDLQSDGNWFSKWFISNIWAPLQAYLKINPNTPAYDSQLKSLHNKMMYSWVAGKINMVLITGHTHQPVFASLTHLERLYIKIRQARKDNDKHKIELYMDELNSRVKKGDKAPRFKKYLPNYFNSGCCCFSDGDITGIEIAAGSIKLIKWSFLISGKPERIVLEEMKLEDLISN